MKLERTRNTSSLASSAPMPHASEALRPVAHTAAGENERRRSRQQELDAAEPFAVGDFQGSEKLLEQAHELAARIVAEGASTLLLNTHTPPLPHIDDEV